MVLTRGVDSFLTYLSELFSLVFRSRPETLRSREQIRVEDVLEHESMDDVVAFLSERRVGRLAYAGLRDLAKEVESDLGLALFPEPGALDRAVSIVEARNLIAHNRGVINAIYLRRTSGDGIVGERIRIDLDFVFGSLEFLVDAAGAVDNRAVCKFRLPVAHPACLPEDVARALSARQWS
jgi:hypothetical protein